MSLRSEAGQTKMFFCEYGDWTVFYTRASNLDEILSAIESEKAYIKRHIENVDNYHVWAGVWSKESQYLIPAPVFRGTLDSCLEQTPIAPRWIIDYNGKMIYVYDHEEKRWVPTGEFLTEDQRRNKVASVDELLAQAEKEAKAAAEAMERMDRHKKEMERLLAAADEARKNQAKP